MYSNGCHVSSDQPKLPCVFGARESGNRIALVGDSHAAQYFHLVEEIAKSRGYSLASWTKSSCPFLAPRKFLHNRDLEGCNSWQKNVLREVVDWHPEVVIVANLTNDPRYSNDIAESDIKFMSRFDAVLTTLSDKKIRALVVDDFPKPTFDVAACGEIESILISIHKCEFPYKLSKLSKLLVHYLDSQNIDSIQPANLLCEKTCPGYRNRANLYRDNSHLSLYGASTLRGIFEDELDSLKSYFR